LEGPRQDAQIPWEIGLWLACLVGVALLPSGIGWILPLALACAAVWRFMTLQAPLADDLGMLAAASLCGSGLRILLVRRRRDARHRRLQGPVAPASQARWEGLLREPSGRNGVEGLYIALRPGGSFGWASWGAWAQRHDAFCESMDSGALGFLLPLEPEAAYPLDAVQELRRLQPQAVLACMLGRSELESEMVFENVRWLLSGIPKAETLAMLHLGRPGSFLVTEADYALVRQNVKIQLIGEHFLLPEAQAKKIFNIIDVF
jgi:hypothetical protein